MEKSGKFSKCPSLGLLEMPGVSQKVINNHVNTKTISNIVMNIMVYTQVALAKQKNVKSIVNN